MDDLIIKTKRLTKIYGEQMAVNAVDLHVKKGRIFGLLGRNGAGKTTIMKMILGLATIKFFIIIYNQNTIHVVAPVHSSIIGLVNVLLIWLPRCLSHIFKLFSSSRKLRRPMVVMPSSFLLTLILSATIMIFLNESEIRTKDRCSWAIFSSLFMAKAD